MKYLEKGISIKEDLTLLLVRVIEHAELEMIHAGILFKVEGSGEFAPCRFNESRKGDKYQSSVQELFLTRQLKIIQKGWIEVKRNAE